MEAINLEVNLLEETLATLIENGKEESDVEWVGSVNYGYATWDEFKDVANIYYDAGYGSPKVAQDLLVVGTDWWLERHEYDGAEWWEFKQLPQKPERKIELKNVAGGMWNNLEELNSREVK